MSKMMSKDDFDVLAGNIGKAAVMFNYADLISEEIKEALSYEDWRGIKLGAVLESKDVPDQFIANAFKWMFKKADTLEQWVEVYGYTKDGSPEEKTALDKLNSAEASSLEFWGFVLKKATNQFKLKCDAKIKILAEKRIREIILQKQ